MKKESFVLKEVSPDVPWVDVKIPEDMEIVEVAPDKLTMTGDVNVTTIAVYEEGEVALSGFEMLERARKMSEMPVCSKRDLEILLTRGMEINHGGLLTGIKVRGWDFREYWLYLDRRDNQWVAAFQGVVGHFSNFQVLCCGQ